MARKRGYVWRAARRALAPAPIVAGRSAPPARFTRTMRIGSPASAVRWGQLLCGLALYGLAAVLMIRSGLGLGPWDAFHVGLSRLTGLSVGAASIAVGVAIVGATWFIGVRPGPGTLANMVLIGVFIDILLPVVPHAHGWEMVPYHFAGIVLLGLATGMYIAPGLGKGPRDGMMLAVSDGLRLPVGRVRTGIEATVLLLGWWMGATIGVGTVLFALAIGPVTQWSLRLFGVVTRPPRGAVSTGDPPRRIPEPTGQQSSRSS